MIHLGVQSSHALLNYHLEPDRLTGFDQSDEAREDTLLHNLQRSLEYSNPYTEYSFLSNTAAKDFETSNWAAAEISVRRILDMRRDIHSGPLIRGHPLQIRYDHAQYGATMIQIGDFETALLCFIIAEKEQHEDYAPAILERVFALQDMDEFICIALYVGRMSLLLLMIFPRLVLTTHRRPIQAAQYSDFDATFQTLLSERVSSTWRLSKGMAECLDRIILPSVTVTSEGISNDGEHLDIQEIGKINSKLRIARLLGSKERKGYAQLDMHVTSITANAPNLPLKMDLRALQRCLPSEQESMDMMPDYRHWWQR
jgi:hypothetical protein